MKKKQISRHVSVVFGEKYHKNEYFNEWFVQDILGRQHIHLQNHAKKSKTGQAVGKLSGLKLILFVKSRKKFKKIFKLLLCVILEKCNVLQLYSKTNLKEILRNIG